ncbi:hypothetical protein Hamer_G020680 [Homarus americanus]|uniref:Fibronectin type-III domain-containing protein n=1 Tax=Homarus americanus TaxID=6706 RepID=A0A8J5MNK9_HOMAM|nr:hypothetical protein Hamer_G020680 [Homarus americanus]
MSKPQKVLLTYQQPDRTATLSVTTTYKAQTSSVEVVKYNSSDSDVFKDPKTCALTPSRRSTAGDETECTTAPFTIPEEEIDLVLLVVGVTAESKVQESVVVDFEDYKTTVQQLTADAFEVRFAAKENTLYKINVTPNGGAFNTSTVQCGAEDNKKCNVYFISVTAGHSYIASVKKDGTDGDKNVVAASFNMESNTPIRPWPEPSRKATLTLQTHDNTHVLEVCVDGDVSTTSTYNLVILDMVGKTSSKTQTLNNKCFSEINLSVNVNQQLRILAYTDDKNRTVVLETNVYLLDMSETLQMTQIGGKVIKASWTNNNNGDVTYTIDLGSHNTTSQVPCKAGHRCLTYLHLNDDKDNWRIDVTENNQGTVQKMQVNVATVDIPDLSLKTHSIQWDDRLRVCFPKVEGAARYELGLQKGPVYLETTPKARVETQTDGGVCVFSSDKVDVGAYINLWMLVTAFNHDGGIVASGESTWNDIFLSVDRTVHAAIKEKHIITSWYLLEDASTVDSFHVTFRSADNTTINSYSASTSSSSHTFAMPKPGKYTACVVAQKSLPKINSEEVCNVDVPTVSGDKPKTTADDAVLVTWQPPLEPIKEVSGFYVNWTKTYSKSTVVDRLPPFSLVRLHRTQSDKLQDDSKGFIIVPASDTSVQIDGLDKNEKYSFCISAVMDSVVGQPDCQTSDLSVVNWSSSIQKLNFLVEWTPDGEGKQGHIQVKGETSYTLSCSPGNWKVSVRTVSDESYSDPATVDATFTGINQVPEQVGESSIKVSWWELPPPEKNQKYTISVYQNNELKRSLPHICSGHKTVDDCSVVFEDLVARVVDPVPYEINIKSSDNTTFKSNFTIKPIPSVTSLTQTIKSSDKVVVGWQQVDGAQFYTLSLYSDAILTDIRVEHKVTLPTSFTLTEDNMMGNVVTIQACVDDNHCGDPLKITINDPVPPSENNSVIAVSVLGGILGTALVVYIVGAVVMSQKKKRGLKKAIERQQEKVIEMSPPPQPLYNEWGARRLGTRPTAPPRPLANKLP